MTAKGALRTVLGVALAGVAFSGYLSVRELAGRGATCPAVGAPGTILGYPACVYGFFVFLLIAFVAVAGLVAAEKAGRP